MVAALDRSHLDALYEAQKRQSPGTIGDNSTKDFMLRHVFGIAPELVQGPSDLLRSLLRRHHRGLRLPELLDDRLIHGLRQNEAFAAWPLEVIVPDREAFFAFLQERWPGFLDRLDIEGGPAAETVSEPATPYGLEFSGPVDLPFDHDDVRVFMDNLFLEGMLEPVSHPRAASLADSWAVVGVRIDPAADLRRRWDGLFETVSEGVPGPDARHVADKVDRIMHGMELGTAGMHNQVRQWAEQGVLAELLEMLLERGFAVFLTADHGNVEATGCGRPGEGSLADLRGTRARIFNDASLRARVHERFPDAIAWPPIGLPNEYLALIAPHRTAFVRQGDKLVGHGGITVEKVIVPLVRIERR